MSYASVEHFYFTYGRGRLEQMIEILEDGQPAPQERIAALLQISKSAVSELLKRWGLRWYPEFPQSVINQIRLLLEFDALNLQDAEDHLQKISKRTPVLILPDERHHRA